MSHVLQLAELIITVISRPEEPSIQTPELDHNDRNQKK